jgi:predicted enzyme related to lactoylglutathione lyase
MSITIRHVTVDCADPYELAGFWHEVTGWPRADDDFPGDPEASLTAPDGATGLWFQQVPEPKAVKNRVHFDIASDRHTRDEEVARLIGLGAALVADHRRPDGSGFVVLADPVGNEFCVLRSAAERARSAQ